MQKQKGFTLIELLVVLSIVGIIVFLIVQNFGTSSYGAPLYPWRDCVVNLPPGKVFDQVTSTKPLSWAMHNRRSDDFPPKSVDCVVPGWLYTVTVTFQEH